MEIRDFYRLLIRHLLLISLATLLGISVSTAVTIFTPKSYTAQAQLFVSIPPAAIDIGLLATGGNFTQQRVKTYANVINGPDTLKPVIEALELDVEWSELAKKVKGSAPLDTSLINLTVSEGDPVLAAALANAIGKQFESTAALLEVEDALGSSPVKVTLAKYAVVPESPSSPKILLNLLLGLILGFGLGVGIGILCQIFDDTVKNEDQLDELALLGAVGFDPEAENKPLISEISAFSTRSEAFRQLRTNIEFLRADNPPQVISIASPLPGEGKTTTVLNLGIAFAQSGYKILCMECDLRRPSTSEYIKYNADQSGVTEILSGKIPLKSQKSLNSLVKYDESTGIHFLTSGKQAPNPAELLDSPTFEKLIRMLRKEFDYILIDSPPLLPVTDGGLIAQQADGVLLVVKAGSTKVDQFRGGRDLLSKVNASVLGVLLNMIPLNRNGESYGYRYGYSYSYQRKYGVYGAGDYGVELVKGEEDRPYAPKIKVRDVAAEREAKRKQRKVERLKRKIAKAQEEREKLDSDTRETKEYPPIHVVHSPEVVTPKFSNEENPKGQLRLVGDPESVDIELQIKLPRDSRLAKALAEESDK
jgi:non-specific protein-tyrosine kinase